jgi:hypothetical protein
MKKEINQSCKREIIRSSSKNLKTGTSCHRDGIEKKESRRKVFLFIQFANE